MQKPFWFLIDTVRAKQGMESKKLQLVVDNQIKKIENYGRSSIIRYIPFNLLGNSITWKVQVRDAAGWCIRQPPGIARNRERESSIQGFKRPIFSKGKIHSLGRNTYQSVIAYEPLEKHILVVYTEILMTICCLQPTVTTAPRTKWPYLQPSSLAWMTGVRSRKIRFHSRVALCLLETTRRITGIIGIFRATF